MKAITRRILVWLVWYIALLVFLQPGYSQPHRPEQTVPLLGIVTHDDQSGSLFPWQKRYRWKKKALGKYRAWRKAYRRARRMAELARLALRGMVRLSQVVEWLTVGQVRYQLGALPVLYALLETLQVRQIINRHCRSKGEVEHGTVALVLILNRLMFPLPLYQVADWVGQTVLGQVLQLPAKKFNDDRLGRTLDALYPHLEVIWLAVVDRALSKAQIDLSVIFYDLTAFITHGRYEQSELIDFGFAHNTPSNKRKLKLGLNTVADGNLPWLHRLWSGRTADQATVQANMDNLADWLKRRGYSCAETLVVGDRAMLNAELAHLYQDHDLRYLAGLSAKATAHKALLTRWSERELLLFPLTYQGDGQYWGRPCQVSLTHQDRTLVHKGLVVLAGPLRDQLRQARQQHLQALDQELQWVRDNIGQPRLRTLKAVHKRVGSKLGQSKVGKLMKVTVYETPTGQINMYWQIDPKALYQAQQRDGRYLLVTNDWSLSPQQMWDLYRQKDGGEKRFRISKSDLQVSPLYLHHDRRIASMLLLNMLALLAYSLLERQIRQHRLQLTTRQLIKRLDQLTVIETHCWDGSRLRRLASVDPDTVLLLSLVLEALDHFVRSVVEPRPPQPRLAASPLQHPCLC